MSRIETDSLGEVSVADEAYWGAQTQRSLINFAIGNEKMPLAVLHALVLIKKAAARVNNRNGDLPADIARLIDRPPMKYSTVSTTTSSRWSSGKPAAARKAT